MTVQTIEKTSKELKGWLIGFRAAWIIGFVVAIWCWSGPVIVQGIGVYMILVGSLGVICVKVLIWWRHG